MITRNEKVYFNEIIERVKKLKSLFTEKGIPCDYDPDKWYSFLNEIKAIQGNANNDVSFIATMMAKDYLERKFIVHNFDAGLKPQGAPGLDIDLLLNDGKRLIAEIKTTSPYKSDDLGAQ